MTENSSLSDTLTLLASMVAGFLIGLMVQPLLLEVLK